VPGVLVAVSIPIFTAQLKKARLATNQANARAAKAAVVATVLQEGWGSGSGQYSVTTGRLTVSGSTGTSFSVISGQPQDWTVDNAPSLATSVYSTWNVYVDAAGNVTYSYQ
jgi:hypothetical protein